ncbi:MAG: TlpA disulfide reductase family protein [Pirellulales bacterium]
MKKSAALIAVASVFLAGCEYSATSSIRVNSTTDSETTADAGHVNDDVKLSILGFDEIQALVASKRGKVVVMDAWSTACPPCMKDFHNLVELSKQYGGDELACISLSFDFEGIGKPEDVQAPVLKFLQSQGAAFDNVMSNEESDALYRKFKLNSVPAVFVYDRAGKLRERFENEGAYAKVRSLVAELVKESPPAESASDGASARP